MSDGSQLLLEGLRSAVPRLVEKRHLNPLLGPYGRWNQRSHNTGLRKIPDHGENLAPTGREPASHDPADGDSQSVDFRIGMLPRMNQPHRIKGL